MSRPFKLTLLLIGVFTLGADQFLKLLMISKIPADGIFLLNTAPFTARLIPLVNEGLAFGLPMPNGLAIGFVSLICAALIFLLIKAKAAAATDARLKKYELVCLTLILTSALSNLLNRVTHGGVIDFFELIIYNFHWPAFNLADAIIVISLGALITKINKVVI